VKSEVLSLLDDLVKDRYEIRIKPHFQIGPSKRISQILDIPFQIKIKIGKIDQDGNNSRFPYSYIKNSIVNLIDNLSDRYSFVNISSGSNIGKRISDKIEGEVIEGRHLVYEFLFNLIPGFLPPRNVKNDEETMECFLTIRDMIPNFNIKKIGDDYSKLYLENLRQSPTAQNFGGNVWTPLTSDEKKELMICINQYMSIHNMEIFDITIKNKNLVDRHLKTYEDLVNLMKGDVIYLIIIFKKGPVVNS
jgi:hypothetical protein